VAIIIIIIHGVGIPVITITRTAIIQRNTPNEYHGRLFSVVHLAVVGMTALSSAFVGILASVMSVTVIFLFFGLGAVVSGIVGLMSSSLRKIELGSK